MKTKTSYKCACCSYISASVNSLVELTDANHEIVKVFECSRCHSLVPVYQSLKGNQITQAQVFFHERYWSDTDKASLIEERNELAETVKELSRYIGEPNKRNLILEIGSGRGTMLSALHNAGYTAIGCEPSEKLATLAKEFLKISDRCLLNFDSKNFFRWIKTDRTLRPRVAILWHVLEHLHEPCKVLSEIRKLENIEVLILQLPLLHKPYIYREHLFFATNGTLHYIAGVLDFDLIDTKIDRSNLFVTAVFTKSSRDVRIANVNNGLNPVDAVSSLTPFSQCLSVRDDSIAAQAAMLKERASAMQEMEAMIAERDDSIAAQAAMLKERASAMQEMEAMISERDDSIAAQAAMLKERASAMQEMEAMIAERDDSIAAQAAMLKERASAMQEMEAMIAERDDSIAAQAAMLKERASAMQEMEAMIAERDDSIAAQAAMLKERASAMQEMEAMIAERDDSIAAQAAMLKERASAMQEMEAMIAERDDRISEYQKSLYSKNQLINEVRKNTLFRILFSRSRLLNEK